MERILVSMNGCRGAWEALSRAISLAKRIEAKVYALLVLHSSLPKAAESAAKDAPNVRERLELLIGLAKADGIGIEYFISEGSYEEEVVQFVVNKKITLLVVELADGEHRHTDRGLSAIRKILPRIRCKVELVSSRKSEQFKQ